ncbi:MAG: carboxypeptidase-like regulatory domain-containing protein [Bacteroidota bacterium]
MRSTTHVLLSALMFGMIASTPNTTVPTAKDNLNESGYTYKVHDSKINTKYSEMASSLFRNRLVIVSSKKIGALGNGVNQKTQEPYMDLFCSPIDGYGQVSQPILFSRILNTKGNEGFLSFSPDEHTVYYTRSTRDRSENYKLYKADLEKDSYGNWINHTELSLSSDSYSVEHPRVSHDGKYLFFSSNMPEGFGGFDLYKAEILKDGTLGEPKNLGAEINTDRDEKYPFLNNDSKELYFSSEGHDGIGGFDIFISNRTKGDYTKPRNLGESINSEYDEIAFVYVSKDKGFFSTNKENLNSNSFDMRRFKSTVVYQNLEGIVVSDKEKPLPNTTVILLDEDGNELQRQITGVDAFYSFKIKPYENYSLMAVKDGFEKYRLRFRATEIRPERTFKEVLKLSEDDSNEQ